MARQPLLDPRLHKPVVVGLQAFFNPESALASQAGCRALVWAADAKWLAQEFEFSRRRENLPWGVAVEIEPMFSVEAKKRQARKPADFVVANLRQQKHSKASDQAADVCGVSPRMVQYACRPIDNVRKLARGGRESRRDVWRCETPPPPCRAQGVEPQQPAKSLSQKR